MAYLLICLSLHVRSGAAIGAVQIPAHWGSTLLFWLLCGGGEGRVGCWAFAMGVLTRGVGCSQYL